MHEHRSLTRKGNDGACLLGGVLVVVRVAEEREGRWVRMEGAVRY